jgi:hypothetical protein
MIVRLGRVSGQANEPFPLVRRDLVDRDAGGDRADERTDDG